MAELVNDLASSVASLETQRIIKVIIEEGPKQIERVEVVLLHRVWHRQVTFLIEVFVSEGNSAGLVVDHISLEVD